MIQQSPTPLLRGPLATCHNVSDGFDERGEGGDVGLAVLPHGLPYHQTAGQAEGQIRLLEKKNAVKKKLTNVTSDHLFSACPDPDLNPVD